MRPRKRSNVQQRLDTILAAATTLTEAMSNLFRRDEILDDICDEAQRTLRSDLVTIQLIRFDEDVIEAARGIGQGAKWIGRAKHYLEDEPALRDIQADIVKTRNTEIIGGSDPRFDEWLYQEYGHDRFTRIFAPILVMYDSNGNAVDDWGCQCQWVVTRDEFNARQHTVLEIRQPDRTDLRAATPTVIGTIEAGYESRARVEPERAVALTQLISRRAGDIRRALLPYVLETVAKSAMQVVGADAATLHYHWRSDRQRYAYEINSGLSTAFLNATRGEYEALGERALREGQPVFRSDRGAAGDATPLSRLSPRTFSEGIKAILALPLSIGDTTGVLYLHYRRSHRITNGEVRWAQLLASRAIDAIRQATTYDHMRYVASQLVTLHNAAQSLARDPEDEGLFARIAANAANFVAADFVTGYEYIEADRAFVTPPAIAGRLRVARELWGEVTEGSVPFQIVRGNKDVYAEHIAEDATFRDSSFVNRERIMSTAALLLRTGEEVVGVLFINFRRPHAFPIAERQLLETLASSAALAIKNRRWMRTLSDVDREIIATLEQDKLLDLIVSRAVQITGADRGEIRLIDAITDELVIKARRAADASDGALCSEREHDGLAQWVAENRCSASVSDVATDPRTPGTLGAQLSVPLLARDGEVVGVLTMGSRRTQAFEIQHQRMLEALANDAVIAIQNVETKEHLLATERIATLADLAGPLMHRLKNECGAILVWAHDIQNDLTEADEANRERAGRIIGLMNELKAHADSLGSWAGETCGTIELYQVVSSALAECRLPDTVQCLNTVPLDLPPVDGSEQKLKDVFHNLVQNAREAMFDKGTLRIEARVVEQSRRSWIVTTVRDNGPGIPEGEQDKIFQPDYSTKPGHRGFGLWWARAYVRRLRGRLTVESRPGEGACFTVVLPTENGPKPL